MKQTKSTPKNEIQAVTVKESDIHKMVSTMQDFQHTRIIASNRFHGTQNNQLIAFIEGLESVETNMKLLIKSEVQKYPIHKWIISNRGLSFDLAGQIIGTIIDIERFSNISKLWAYFGLAVVDVCHDCGKRWYPIDQKAQKAIHIAQRKMEQYEKKIVKEGKSDFNKDAMESLCSCSNPHIKKTSQKARTGQLLDYNPKAKMLAYKIGTQFIKQGDFYRTLYDQFKAEYMMREDLKNEMDIKKGKKIRSSKDNIVESKGTAHIHAMAQRKMVKIFLQHLWVQWRTLENLPVSDPYVIARLGHSDYIKSNIP